MRNTMYLIQHLISPICTLQHHARHKAPLSNIQLDKTQKRSSTLSNFTDYATIVQWTKVKNVCLFGFILIFFILDFLPQANYELVKNTLGAHLIIPRQADGAGCRPCLA